MEFSGRLSAFPPGNILQWAGNERRTGALVVRRSKVEKRIYFEEGRIVGCLSDDPAEYYGQHLLLHGFLDEKTFLRALYECKRRSRRLGAVLVELDLLTAEEIETTLRQQIIDSVCDIFLWERGVFFFEADSPEEEEIRPTPIDTVAVVMEGSRWIDELARIRKVFVHDHIVLHRGQEATYGALTPLEKKILAATDGAKDLRQVHSVVRGSFFRFLEAAYRLCLREALDIAAIADFEDQPSQEIRLVDLMLEQVAEEERAILDERQQAIPLAALREMVPVWAKNLSEEESNRVSEALREFCRRLDGERALGDALSKQPERLREELEFLQVRLSQGNLALLPCPIDRLDSELEVAGGETPWWRRLVARKE
ncbi:MAG: DUF4388 domain-containing protein [Acidobacteriota bacterium]